MTSHVENTRVSKQALWAARIVSGLTAAFMLFDSALHLAKPAPVIQAFNQLGFPISLSLALGAIELLSVLIYLYPRTSILGAILLTAYLGGAVSIQMRVGNPLFAETLLLRLENQVRELTAWNFVLVDLGIRAFEVGFEG